MGKSHLLNWAIIAFAGILFTLPALIYGFPSYNHDGWVHSLWYSHFSNQLWAGEPYPRWLHNLNQGLGSPALFFYPPLPYYVTSLFKPFFRGDVDGLRQLGVSASLAAIASGWTAYLWLGRMVPRTPSLIASILYLVMPYHLVIDLYLRGAFAEVWGFVWIPLIMFFAHKLKSGERFSGAGLAVSYSLLIVSHLPTALIFSPVPILYVIVLAERSNRAGRIIQATAAMALGIGLSAIYLLPALTLREFVSMQEMSKPEINFENWFVLASIFARGLPAYLSWIVLCMVAVAGCAYFIVRQNRKEAIHSERAFWAVAVIGTVILMTPPGKPLWKLLPLLQNVQFPFRFNAILCVATTVLIAFALASLEFSRSFRSAAPWSAITVSAVIWILIIPLSAWREYKIHPVTRANYRELIENNQDAPEYRPRWAERDAFYAMLGELRQARQVDQVNIIEGNADVIVESWEPRKIFLRLNSVTGATLRVKQLYFSGWGARTEDGVDLTVRPATPAGLLEMVVPAGSQRVKIELSPGMAERWGQYLSAFSLLILLAIVTESALYRQAASRAEST